MEAIGKRVFLLGMHAFRLQNFLVSSNKEWQERQRKTYPEKPEACFYVDFHTHCLPGLDDGAKDLDVSLQMLHCEASQQVDLLIATPHYYPHRETIEGFLQRRETAYSALLSCPEAGGISLLRGAEVYLERDLEYEKDLSSLCFTGTNCLLLEFPYRRLEDWVLAAVENIGYKYRIRPILAHMDRYRQEFTPEDYDRIFAIENVVCQINAEALLQRSGLSFVLSLIKKKVPLVFGSDCHDMGDRAPVLARGLSVLREKVGDGVFFRLMEEAASLVSIGKGSSGCRHLGM